MDNSLQEKYLPFFKQHWLPLLLGVFGLMLLGYGLMAFSGPKSEKSDMVFESAEKDQNEESQTKGASANNRQIVIDVEGAVQKPGVYTLPENARVQDALVTAGGMSDQADRSKVAQGLNLAASLTDGAKLYIPFLGETAAVSGGSGGQQTVLGSTTDLININSASSSELDTLKGVGPVTAEKIISNRPYGSIEDLLAKKVVGQKVFTDIKDKISVY